MNRHRLLMAIAMLHAKTSQVRQIEEEADESVEKESGTISTVILSAHWRYQYQCIHQDHGTDIGGDCSGVYRSRCQRVVSCAGVLMKLHWYQQL
jgi:hypothetical protein